MAGEGLIWSGIGQGIANAGSTIGSFMMRAQERDAEREYRERQAQETRDFRAEQNSLYKRTVEEQMAGRAGTAKDPGIQPADLQPGGKYAGMVAGQLDMTENQLADLQQYRKSGDLSKYAKPIGTTLDDTYGEQTVTEVPQALKEEFKLKAKALSQLEESYALKGSFDDVMKGRNIGFKTGMGQAAFDKPEVAGKAGQAVSASEGKPLINIEGGQQYNQFTGTGSTTPLGKSQIAENQAQAGQAGALAKKYGKDIEKIDAEIKGGMFSKNSSEKLTSWVNSANATITSLDNGSKGSTPEEKAEWKTQRDAAVALRTNAINLQNAGMAAKANPPEVRNPGPTNPAAKRPVFNQKTGLLEYR